MKERKSRGEIKRQSSSPRQKNSACLGASQSNRAGTAKTSSRSTVSGPARRSGAADGTDALVAKAEATQALAAKMPHNTNKALEHGKSANRPQAGQTVKPANSAA